MKKYKLSTRISVYIAVILSLAMSGLTIRSLIVKRNVHSVSVTLYGIVFVLLLVVSAVSLIVYIYKSKIGIYVSIACLAYGIIMKDSPLQLIIIFLPVIYAMFSTREQLE
jgi:CDP-diglyceride synthetase